MGSCNNNNASNDQHTKAGPFIRSLLHVLAVESNDVDHKFSTERQIKVRYKEEEDADADEDEEEAAGKRGAKGKATSAIHIETSQVPRSSAQTISSPQDGMKSLIINIIKQNNIASGNLTWRHKRERKEKEMRRRHELGVISTNTLLEERTSALRNRIQYEAVIASRMKPANRITVRDSCRVKRESWKKDSSKKANQIGSIFGFNNCCWLNKTNQQLHYSCLMHLLYSASKYVLRKLITLLFLLIALLD